MFDWKREMFMVGFNRLRSRLKCACGNRFYYLNMADCQLLSFGVSF